MDLSQNERTVLFIDGTSLYSTARNLNFDVDYKAMLGFFKSRTQLVRAYYYTAVTDSDDYTPLVPLIDWLTFNGYQVEKKTAREYTDRQTGISRFKSNMSVDIAVDMFELSERVDHMILFSGDGDFKKVIESIQRKGVRVTVISSNGESSKMISDDLRRQCDSFVELNDIKDNFTRVQSNSDRSNRPRREYSPAGVTTLGGED